jgi:hypothetical protein
MFKYNCIVSIYKKVEGDRIPLTKFTMYKENRTEIADKVVQWVMENLGYEELENISFRYEEVEENTDEWTNITKD